MGEGTAFSDYINLDTDVELSKKGNKEAFGRIIRKHKLSMYRTAKSILSNEYDIEDAISDTILKAYLNIKSLKEDKYFKSWLLRILINQCYSIIKKNKREVPNLDIDNSSSSYEDKYENYELLRGIKSLDEKYRIVTLLFYYDDMSLKEISQVLGIPVGTVKSRLSRAKSRLEAILREEA